MGSFMIFFHFLLIYSGDLREVRIYKNDETDHNLMFADSMIEFSNFTAEVLERTQNGVLDEFAMYLAVGELEKWYVEDEVLTLVITN